MSCRIFTRGGTSRFNPPVDGRDYSGGQPSTGCENECASTGLHFISCPDRTSQCTDCRRFTDHSRFADSAEKPTGWWKPDDTRFWKFAGAACHGQREDEQSHLSCRTFTEYHNRGPFHTGTCGSALRSFFGQLRFGCLGGSCGFSF